MNTQMITVKGKTITIPDYYQKVDSMPDEEPQNIKRSLRNNGYLENSICPF